MRHRLNFQSFAFVVSALLFAGLPAEANAPAGQYTSSAGTVLDSKTGLTWQAPAATGTYTWASARTYCPTLGAGWRLPTIKELASIVDLSKAKPATDRTAFSDVVQSDTFWSATPLAGSSASAWYVYFTYGDIDYINQTTTFRVRCVR